MKSLQEDAKPELATWNRSRSDLELRSFISTRFNALSGVEVE